MPRRAAQRTTQRGPAALDLFASCAPGLEELLAAEIAALGLEGAVLNGGVALRGDLATAARLNLWLRTATRVLVRLGEVRATSFAALVHEARKLPFELALPPGVPVALRVTCRRSRLYHSQAVAERLHVALQDRVGRAVARAEAASEADDGSVALGPQLLFARFQDDVCTISADASGALLHQRGYRARPARAPLRETLAAALLLAAGYDGGPFVDPLCGSGTIAIEAALIARRRAPGLARAFALQRWPGHDASAFARMVEAARAQEIAPARAPAAAAAPAAIRASDADPEAVAACRENARRAGVEADLSIDRRELADLPAASAPTGLCASNPPYGVRVGAAGGDLSRLWRELGDRARARLRGWTLAVLSPDPRLARAAALAWQPLLRTENGGIPVDLLRAQL